jgi:hypothetical protein
MAKKKGTVKAEKKISEQIDGGPAPSLGGEICDFIEHYAIHGEGDFVSQPLSLHSDFEMMIWRLFELQPCPPDAGPHVPDMVNTWSECINVGPKDIGKSLTSAALGFADAFGPVVFDGWNADGDPIGRPRDSVRVVCVGLEEGQSRNAYGPMVWNVDRRTCSDNFRRDFGAINTGSKEIAVSTRVLLPANRGLLLPMTSAAASKEGAKASLMILEEPHLWVLPRLVKLYQSLKRALVKRQNAILLHSTNSYDPTEHSALQIAIDSVQAGTEDRSFINGNFLSPGDISDEKLLRDQPLEVIEAALAKVYGSAWGFVNRPALISYARSGSTPDGDARRYTLNQARTAKGKWMFDQLWANKSTKERLKPGDLIAIGFDGGRYRDATALVACRLSDRLIQPLGIWERPPNAPEDWEVPAHLVDECLREATTTYKLALMYGDPPKWREELQKWSLEFGDETVVEFNTAGDKIMAFAIDHFEEALKPGGQLRHTGDEVLTRHILNAETMKVSVRLEVDGSTDQDLAATDTRKASGVRYGVRLIKPIGIDKAAYGAMIDGAIASVLAYEAAHDAVKNGIGTKHTDLRIW